MLNPQCLLCLVEACFDINVLLAMSYHRLIPLLLNMVGSIGQFDIKQA